MVARRKATKPRKQKFVTKLKQDPAGATKAQVNKTGLFKYILGAVTLGAIGGSQMVSALDRIPIVGGVLSASASRGSSLVSKMRSR
jgi:hypothetical protein